MKDLTKQLREAALLYKEKFGKSYATYVGMDKSDEEILDEINQCLETDTPQAPPVYNKNLVY